jgi:hypothetical protein
MLLKTRMNLMLGLLATAALAGCERNAVLIPNSDASLNKTATSFAQEAAARFPYPADALRSGELPARAEVGYMWNVINLAYFGKQDLADVELWINQRYVLPLEKLEAGKVKRIAFKMIYDQQGQHLPHGGVVIDTVELRAGGKIFDVPKQIGG